ncbi:hypothetical protein ACS0PU_009169 [Formica fusca]|jgi:hypothetical protein
MIKKY